MNKLFWEGGIFTVGQAVLMASAGTGFTFLMTMLGAALVFLFRGEIKDGFQKIFLGFAAGVMIAASVWSLLIPSIDMSSELGQVGWIAAAGGFLIGAGFMMLLDKILPHLHPGESEPEGPRSKLQRTTMLMLAVTLHNIPEGMAVGLAFSLAANSGSGFAAAAALALGIGIQNFPEGAAISLPLRKEGMSASRAFGYGALSGAVEPVFGILTVLIAGAVQPLMPWLLAFAAGAMMYVVAEELIPEANLDSHDHKGTIGVLAGFVIMMVLDVALG